MGALGWGGRWRDSVVTPCPADLLLDSPAPQGSVRRGRGTSTAVWNSSGLSRDWERMSAYGAWPPRLPPGLSLARGALRDAQYGERFGTERKAWRHEEPAKLAWPSGEAAGLCGVEALHSHCGPRRKVSQGEESQHGCRWLDEGGRRRGSLRK